MKPILNLEKILPLPVIMSGFLFILMAAIYIGHTQAVAAKFEGDYPKENAQGTNQIYLPIVFRDYPLKVPFGVETNLPVTNDILEERLSDLPVSWIRMNQRISWNSLQPNEGDPILWEKLVGFENELRLLKSMRITPIVIVDDSPRWATIEPTSCGAIKTDKFQAFADFIAQLVARYSTSEFNVHIWELGNEVDVDPQLVQIDNAFGCWGDIDDPFYGGEHYGEFLKVVTPAIRSVDPKAQIWIGGLLLASPNTTDPDKGHPELFLQGILEAGASPYFDVVPYHIYVSYLNVKLDHDLLAWSSWGGGVVGKAEYLRTHMQQYGVEKPVFLNETGLKCAPIVGGNPVSYCNPPEADYFEMQANHLVRTFVRALSEDVKGIIWYTLEGPGWQNTGLLDGGQNPRPVYIAYQHLIERLRGTTFVQTVSFGTDTEAYIFSDENKFVIVAWAISDKNYTITVPQTNFLEAYDRDGNLLAPTPNGDSNELTLKFNPIFIEYQK